MIILTRENFLTPVQILVILGMLTIEIEYKALKNPSIEESKTSSFWNSQALIVKRNLLNFIVKEKCPSCDNSSGLIKLIPMINGIDFVYENFCHIEFKAQIIKLLIENGQNLRFTSSSNN
jgi:hypothetical protein